MERPMSMRLSLAAIIVLTGVSIAIAQQQVPADPQGHDPRKSQQDGKEEPGSHSSTASTEVFVNGKLAVPGAPEDSQTVPSKVSERNARLDATPIMALPLGLTNEQRRRIVDSVAKSDAPVEQISAKPADILPATTPVKEFSADLKAEAPVLSDVSFIRTKDKILLVRSPNMVVTGEVSTN
jgi:hypothetical protein